MSDETAAPRDEKATATTNTETAGAPAESAEERTNADVANEDPSPEDLAARNAELTDRMLRLAAEVENLRKRHERDLADTRAYAITAFARDMLTATDSLSRALAVLPAEAREHADATLQSLIDGIELTEREMQRLLAKHGVTPIEAEGQKFDPHKHQAMFEVPDPTRPEGTVVQVVQAGFTIGDRVLRPAMVGVAKGGQKPKPGPEDAASGVDKSV